MKGFSVVGMGVLALIGMAGVAVSQGTRDQGMVRLRLDVERKAVERLQGKERVFWESLQGRALVKPGEVLRYTVTAVNHGGKDVKNLSINQPIPKGMVYVLNSATSSVGSGVKMTYSIDGGRSFVDNPTLKVTLPNGKAETKPAPATVYTHIRWKFGSSLPNLGTVQGSYQVQVR